MIATTWQSPNPPLSKRYLIHDVLGEGGMGVVYHATDRLTGRAVALKQVTINPADIITSFGSADNSLQLAQEFRILSTLRHPHIISVYDYGFDEHQQPFFTMTLLENALPINEAAQTADPLTIMRWIGEVLQALHYLHQHGILHRDLKPTNILVQDNTAYVLDFGLAIEQAQNHDLVGTVAYLAPEAFMGQPITRQSDLYALGVVAYESLTGEHPYNVLTTISSVITQIIEERIERGPLDAILPDTTLSDIMLKLVAKLPQDRYQSADEVIKALQNHPIVQLPSEDHAIRESYLQGARFIGRDAELNTLRNALAAVPNNQGSTWVVAGESGIGKSRLVDEVRIRAMVDGMLVLMGQVTENGAPLQAWTAPLRSLCLEVTISPEEAGILAPLVPDIAQLIDRAVVEPTLLEPAKAEQRLIETIQAIIRRQTRPILIILEDIQWATTTTRALVQRLRADIKDLPVMLIITLRTDEAAQVRTEFDDWQQVQLTGLSDEQLGELSVAMLGENDTDQSQFIEFLAKTTEGNVFFATEVMRALADIGGGLQSIPHLTLPERMVAGGIQAVLRRRLAQMPATSIDLLRLAAIIGRRLDVQVLSQVAPNNLDTWLSIGINANVFDVRDDEWRFAHDQLRETVLADIPPEELPGLHDAAATAITLAYPNDDTHNVALARHYEGADRLKDAAEAAFAVAQQALNDYARPEALNWATKASELYAQVENVDVKTRATVQFFIAEIHYLSGLIDMAHENYRATADILGIELPTEPRGYRLGLLKNVLLHALHEIFRFWHGNQDPELVVLRARTLGRLGVNLMFSDRRTEGAYYTFKSIVLSTEGDPDQLVVERMRRYSLMHYYIIPYPFSRWLRAYYVRRGVRLIDIAHAQGDYSGTGYMHTTASAYHIARCEWEQALAHAQQAQALATERNLWQWYEFSWVMILEYYMCSGRWKDGAEMLQKAQDEFIRLNSPANQAVALNWKTTLAIASNDMATALELNNAFIAVPDDYKTPTDYIVANIARARLYTYNNDLSMARPYAEKAFALWYDGLVNNYPGAIMAFELNQYFLAQYEATPNPDDAAKIETLLKLSREGAANFIIAKAAWRIAQGRWAMLQGNYKRADRLLVRALAIATRNEQRIEAAEAAFYRYQLHMHWPSATDTQRFAALQEAHQRADMLGYADWYRSQLPP